jgi:hypothetical protein
MTELQSLLRVRLASAVSTTKKSSPEPAVAKKATSKAKFTIKTFSVDGRIRLARAAAEMQAKRKGLTPRLVKKAGDAMEAKKRAELAA